MEAETYFDMAPEEVYECYKKAGYRELFMDEIKEKECYSCSSFRGGCKDEGSWCSKKVCKYRRESRNIIPMNNKKEENKNV